MAKRVGKKRGRKPGVKVGPYKKNNIKTLNNDGLDALFSQLEIAIKARIKLLTLMLKRIK